MPHPTRPQARWRQHTSPESESFARARTYRSRGDRSRQPSSPFVPNRTRPSPPVSVLGAASGHRRSCPPGRPPCRLGTASRVQSAIPPGLVPNDGDDALKGSSAEPDSSVKGCDRPFGNRPHSPAGLTPDNFASAFEHARGVVLLMAARPSPRESIWWQSAEVASYRGAGPSAYGLHRRLGGNRA